MLQTARFVFTACAIMMAATSAQAAPRDVGEAIPNPFTLTTPSKVSVGFDEVKGDKGLIILFVRSLNWCPYCIQQVKEWDGRFEKLRKAGYNVITVSYDSPNTLLKAREKHDITLPTYADYGSEMIQAFDILNRDYTEEDVKFYGIPHPTIYVVDTNGIITHRFAEEGYKKRPKANTVVDAVM